MAELTKEWLLTTIAELEEERDATPGVVNVDVAIALAAMKLALASLEAEAVCVIDQSNLDYLNAGSDADVWPVSRTEMGDVLLYRTAPPAPANAEPVAWLWSHRKHPSEVSLVRPEDDEKAEGAHWSGWSCQALYAAPPAPVSVPAAMEMDDDFDSSFEHGKAVGWNAYRAAMLQGADKKPDLTVWYGSMPESNGKANWTAILHRKGEGRCMNGFTIDRSEYPGRVLYAADRVRYLIGEKSERPSILDYDADAHSGYMKTGNSPVIPGGQALVPVEPTLEMIKAGANAASSGMLIPGMYRAMLAAAPQQEVTQALAKGMERYGDAMQKLADSGD